MVEDELHIVHVGTTLTDFSETAALISLMDMVISVDTAVAHLSAAIGRPTWILLPFTPDWRWMLNRKDSPWYAAARLFRQQRHGDWDEVVTRVLSELSRICRQA
jgi:ADP-heptose:LPS heptosyltransferase